MNIVNELTDEAVLVELGQRIARHRIDARMTQEELARRAGVSKRSIERLEKGEGGVRLQILVAVARVLRCLSGLNTFITEVKASPFDMRSRSVGRPRRVRACKRPDRPFKWKE